MGLDSPSKLTSARQARVELRRRFYSGPRSSISCSFSLPVPVRRRAMTTITPRSAKDRPASLDLDRPRDPLDDLIRQLVRLVGGRAAADGARGENTREEIIIDTSVDGVRYLFIRMPPS